MAGLEVRGPLVIELVPHLDAGDRQLWRGDQDERPLSELGWRQARAVAEALASEPIDALFASPALRCRDSLAPLAEATGLEVRVLRELAEEQPEDGSVGERGLLALQLIARAVPSGRVVACSHGDIIPATMHRLAWEHGVTAPFLRRRGQWHRLRFEDGRLEVELRGIEG